MRFNSLLLTIAAARAGLVDGDTNCTMNDLEAILQLDANATAICFETQDGDDFLLECMTDVSEECTAELNAETALYVDYTCDDYQNPGYHVCIGISAGLVVAGKIPDDIRSPACSPDDLSAINDVDVDAVMTCADGDIIGGIGCLASVANITGSCAICIAESNIGPELFCADLCNDVDTQGSCANCVNGNFMLSMAGCSLISFAGGMTGGWIAILAVVAAFLTL